MVGNELYTNHVFNCACLRVSVAIKTVKVSPMCCGRQGTWDLRVEVGQWKLPERDDSYPKKR